VEKRFRLSNTYIITEAEGGAAGSGNRHGWTACGTGASGRILREKHRGPDFMKKAIDKGKKDFFL
jgi:hypothetical protein